MKSRLAIIFIITTLVGGGVYIHYAHYETWANNEQYYFHPDGYNVECEIRLFQSPSPCNAIDENGIIVDTKTGIGNWNGVKWLGGLDFCKDHGGVWNGTIQGCYGLYDVCEEMGGVPRFLKNSLPFPDSEENKPISYLMDCYYGYTPEDNYLYEP